MTLKNDKIRCSVQNDLSKCIHFFDNKKVYKFAATKTLQKSCDLGESTSSSSVSRRSPVASARLRSKSWNQLTRYQDAPNPSKLFGYPDGSLEVIGPGTWIKFHEMLFAMMTGLHGYQLKLDCQDMVGVFQTIDQRFHP